MTPTPTGHFTVFLDAPVRELSTRVLASSTFALADDLTDADVAVLGMSASRLQVVRAEHPDLPLLTIVSTANRRPTREIVALLDAGADACIVEPSAEELLAHLKALTERRLPARRRAP